MLAVAGIIAGALMVGLLNDNPTVIMAAAAGSVLTAIVSPAVGLTIFAMVAPMIGRPVFPAPGYPVIMAGAIVLGCIYRLPIERRQIRVGLPIALGFAFMLYVFIQQLPNTLALYSGESGRDLGALFFKLVTATLTAIGAALVMRERRPFPYLAALLLSAVAASVVAIVMFGQETVGPPISNLAPLGAGDRPSGTFADPNYFGIFVASAIILAVAWFAGWHWGAVRVILLAALAVMIGGLIVSQSRSALVTALSGVVVVAFTRSRRAGLVVVIASFVIGLLALPLLIEWRLENSLGAAAALGAAGLTGSDSWRLGSVLAGPELFLTSPLFGVGLGRFEALAGVASHNWFMTVLAEHGLIGLSLWLAFLFSVARALWRRPRFARTVGFGALAAIVAGSMFLEPPREDQSSVLIIIAIVAALVADWRVPWVDTVATSDAYSRPSVRFLAPGSSP